MNMYTAEQIEAWLAKGRKEIEQDLTIRRPMPIYDGKRLTTRRAFVEIIEQLRTDNARLEARIICEDCGELGDEHECKEIISKDGEPFQFAEEPSPCSRSLCRDCGCEVHGR